MTDKLIYEATEATQNGLDHLLKNEQGEWVGWAYNEDDARRLVACWNACAGIETVSLEAGGTGWLQQATLSACEQRDTLHRQLSLVRGALEAVMRLEGGYILEHSAIAKQVQEALASTREAAG